MKNENGKVQIAKQRGKQEMRIGDQLRENSKWEWRNEKLKYQSANCKMEREIGNENWGLVNGKIGNGNGE